MKTAVIIQARMGSERLAGKVMKQLAGRPLLWHVIQRVKRALTVQEIVVATTSDPQDTMIADECRKWGISVFRGDENDVLGRYYMASQLVKANIICRVTADNPLVEPVFIDMAYARMSYSGEDYVCIDGCPLGTGIELFSKTSLEQSALNADQAYEREHVTPYIRRNSHQFKCGQVQVPFHLLRPDLRLTVDTQEDFCLMETIYERLYRDTTVINLMDVINLFVDEPVLCHINEHIKQRSVC